MILLVGSLTIGLILTFLSLGVYVSFKIFNMADITADGSLTLGAATASALIVAGYEPVLSTLAGAVAGALAGTVTGILHTRFNIHSLLAGILVMTALYSVNLHVMGRSNLPLMNKRTLTTYAEEFSARMFPGSDNTLLWGWEIATRDLVTLSMTAGLIGLAALLLFVFLRTRLGTAMRATGENRQMVRAMGINPDVMIVLGLALANGLVALAGGLLAQYQGFADIQMGIGMVVWGLASVIIGEALTGGRHPGIAIAGALIGSLLFRLLVAIALRWGLNPNNLKLITALFVFAALVAPEYLRGLTKPGKAAAHA